MFLSSWFEMRRKARQARNSPRCSGPRRVRLNLEQLEDRVTPSAGALDLTFSDDGRLAIDIGPNPGTITSYASVLQPDGKLVSVGSGPGGNFSLMRIDANGVLDPTFSNGSLDITWDGGDGMALIVPNTVGGNALNAVTLQADGKIVAAGGRYVVRLTASGQRDSTFGTNGVLTLPVVGTGTGGSFVGTGIVVQPNGRIVVGGYANITGTGNDFAAVRLNADGTVDTTFDGDGIRTVAVSTTPVTGDDRANDIALDADGKIVLAGYATSSTTGTDFTAVRLNTDGSLDTSFDTDGIVVVSTINPGAAADSANALVIQSDGKIVLVGNSNPAGSFQLNLFTAVRLNTDGSLDTTFSGDGIHKVPGTGDSAAPGADDVALLDDGRIVLVGAAPGAIQSGFAYYDFTVAVLTPVGTADTTFSGDGLLIFEPYTDNGAGNALRATGVVVNPAGQIVVSGNSNGLTRPASFARINADGTFDTAFGTNGITNQTYRTLGFDSGFAAALQADGKIVVAGSSFFTFATNADFALARVNPDGTLDTTFGNNGVLTTNLAGQDTAHAVAVQSDGKILAAGGSNQASVSLDTTAGVARYNADGSLDTSFGVGGILNLNLGTSGDVFNTVVFQQDGKIVLGGSIRTSSGTNYDFAVVRLNADGSYDTSFGVGGLVRLAIGTTDQVFSLAIQSDGKILASGSSDQRGAVVRLNADGSLDTTFDTDGIAIFGGTGLNQLRGFEGMALQADGKLVFTGNILTTQPGGSAAHIGVARLNADGSVDTSFSGDGVAPVVIGTGSSSDSIAVTHDGRILVGGRTVGTTDFAVARLLSDGTLDPSFDTDGRVTVDMAARAYGYVDTSTSDDLTALLVQPDGNIVLAGLIGTTPAPGSGGSDFGLARLDGGGVPPIDLQLSNGLIPENAGANALVGTLTTIDPNTLDTHTYTLVSGAGDTNNAQFVIVGDQLRAVASFDYETLPHDRTVRVRTTDQNGFSYDEAFTITITNVNEVPSLTGVPASLTTPEDTAIVYDAEATDPDGPAQTLTFAIASQPTHGTLSGFNAGTGVVTYTPDANYFGADSFTMTVTDGALTSAAGTVNISVNAVNDAPVANPDGYVTNEDTALTIAASGVLANDTDVDGNALTALLVSGPINGTLALNADGAFLYTPNANFHGTDSFTYKANDGTADSNTTTVTIQVRNLVDVSGRSFDDKDNDGLYEAGDGEVGIGGVTVQLFDETSGTLIATRTTAADGSFSFDVNLAAGTYKIVAAQPVGFLDGRETAGNLGGAVDNSQDSNQISGISVGAPGTTADALDYLFADIRPSQAQGLVWRDADNDSQVDFGEAAIAGATIELTGLDERGNAVNRSVTTDVNGIYTFIDLRPSNAAGYTIHEVQPAGYVDGLDVLGTVNGVTVGNASVNDVFFAVVLPRPGSLAENYNFGELPLSEGGVSAGQTATIGFWQNKNGQNLIKSLNGGSTSTQLGNWLASNFSNLYGASAGTNNLTGKTNAEVAAFYKKLFARTAATAAGGGSPKMDAQVMATALAVYVTNQSLAGTTAASYGFLVSANGVGSSTFNVGSNGAAFGVANDTIVSVLNLLLAVNSRSRNGLLYDLDGDGDANDALETSWRNRANNVFSGINELGDI